MESRHGTDSGADVIWCETSEPTRPGASRKGFTPLSGQVSGLQPHNCSRSFVFRAEIYRSRRAEGQASYSRLFAGQFLVICVGGFAGDEHKSLRCSVFLEGIEAGMSRGNLARSRFNFA